MQANLSTIPGQRVVLARVRDARFRGKPAEVQRFIKTRGVVVTKLFDGTRYDTPPENLDIVLPEAPAPKAQAKQRDQQQKEYRTPVELLRQLRKPGHAFLVVETPAGNAEVAINKDSLAKWLNDCAPKLECGFLAQRRQDDELVITVM